MRLKSRQRYLWDLVEHYRRWEPYGGSSADDLMIDFGLTPARFRERLLEAAKGGELDDYWAAHRDLRIRILKFANGIPFNRGNGRHFGLIGA